MSRPIFNRYKIKAKYLYYKQQFRYMSYRIKEGAKQVFIPLAIYQLIRTIIFPTPFDVFLLLVIFIAIVILLLDWI